ncbi:Fic family protein [Candidatus Saccharibacteria bacterium]|nr:Fic family protein [Candidatus Saccharibacteria bacterium]
MADEFIDPYLDLETGILRNFAGANTQEKLRKAETDVAGMAELTLDDIPRSNNLAELQAIHKALFGKIYDWAGEIRTVDIRKGSEEFFLFVFQIPEGAKFVFDGLAKENTLKDLSKEDFVKRLAYFYEQVNFIHPFREGNGRTQRVFWNRVAADAGYFIDWSQVVGDELDKASVEGREHHNLEPLEEMFSRIVKPLF